MTGFLIMMAFAFLIILVIAEERASRPRLPQPARPALEDCKHVWAPWVRKQVDFYQDGGRTIRGVEVQERECLACAYTEREKITSR